MIASSPIARLVARLAALAFGLALSTPIIAASPNGYQVHNLVSDIPGLADNTDANLVNGWGIAMRATSPIWVSDNGTGKSTVYDGTGALKLTVCVPAVSTPCPTDTGVPTGITSNPSSADFLLVPNTAGTAAIFLWATEDGGIAAWNGGANATIKFAATDGAVYKGLALAGNGTSFRLYAADFHNGKIDVLDTTFALTTTPGGFADPTIPAGFHPFNILNLQGDLYVAYALKEADGNDEVAGAGLGFVDVFDADGFLLRRVASGGKLNAPWGMALAPTGFGRFSNHLLVGNFGDGTINAYDLKNATFAGQLRTSNGQVLKIDGLWGIAFGNGFQQQPTNTLFFAAGPDEESHGLYGKIEPAH